MILTLILKFMRVSTCKLEHASDNMPRLISGFTLAGPSKYRNENFAMRHVDILWLFVLSSESITIPASMQSIGKYHTVIVSIR